jgi:hypothetical protein
MAEQETALIAKLDGYVAWAKEEPEVLAGLAAWHWPDFSPKFAANGVSYAGMVLGGEQFPRLLGRVAEIVAQMKLSDDSEAAPQKADGIVDVYTFQQGNASCYRIPSLVALPDGRLLAWIEARNYIGDGCVPAKTDPGLLNPGHAHIGYKVSSDGGRSFGPFVNLTRGQDFSVFLASANKLVLQYPRVRDVGPNMQLISDPISAHAPITWGEETRLPDSLLGELAGANIGPGSGGGIELRTGAHRGRWVFCGHGHARNDSSKALARERATFVIVSDDNGTTWRRTAWVEGLNECNVVETAGGGVYLDSRNQRGPVNDFPANFSKCRCRLGANSHDGGDSFGPVETVPTLPDVTCQGCMVREVIPGETNRNAAAGISLATRYFYSGPNGNAPECQSCHGSSACCNETMRLPCKYSGRCYESVWQSADDGITWSGPHLVDPGPTGYSSVMPVAEAGTVGVLYERYADGCMGSSCRVSFSRLSLPRPSLKNDDLAISFIPDARLELHVRQMSTDVFERERTKATVRWDCGVQTGSIMRFTPKRGHGHKSDDVLAGAPNASSLTIMSFYGFEPPKMQGWVNRRARPFVGMH